MAYLKIISYILIMLPFSVQAALIQYSGNSTANFSSGPISQIDITWSADNFDDSQVTGVGQEFFDVALNTFLITPDPLGATFFNTANTGFQLHYIDGDLFALRVGGLVDGVQNILGGSDDFMARYTPEGGPFQTAYRLANSSAIDGNSFDMVASVNATIVPIPPALWVFGSALFGLLLSKKKISV